MANVDQAFGLRPKGHLLGLDWSNSIKWYFVPATDSTAIFMYDPVILGGTADSTGKFPTVAAGTAGSPSILGVAVAFRSDPPDSQPVSLVSDGVIPRYEYRVASTARYVGVIVDPYVIYECQEDSDSSTLAITNVGQNIDLIAGAGSATTGLSGYELDSSTANTTAALNMKILGLSQTSDGSNAVGDNAVWDVVFNESYFRAATAGI